LNGENFKKFLEHYENRASGKNTVFSEFTSECILNINNKDKEDDLNSNKTNFPKISQRINR
jgi:hypothetical protein